MHATVTDALFEALPRHGIATVRFNFRGVGASGGEHDDGLGERLDIVAAIELLAMFVDGAARARPATRSVPTSRCASPTTRSPAGTRSLPPLRTVDVRRLRRCDRSPPEAPRGRRARPVQPAGHAREPRRRSGATPRSRCIPGADHFLSGRLVARRRGLRRVRARPQLSSSHASSASQRAPHLASFARRRPRRRASGGALRRPLS